MAGLSISVSHLKLLWRFSWPLEWCSSSPNRTSISTKTRHSCSGQHAQEPFPALVDERDFVEVHDARASGIRAVVHLPGSPSKESQGKHSIPHRKRILIISAGTVAARWSSQRQDCSTVDEQPPIGITLKKCSAATLRSRSTKIASS